MYDAIVVLACGVGKDGLSKESKRRVKLGVDLFKKWKAKRILMSGSQSNGIATESELMKEYAILLGVPKSKIIIENESVDTISSAYFVGKIAQNLEWKRIAVVTSSFHARRTSFIFKHAMPDVSIRFKYVDSHGEAERERKLLDMTKRLVPIGSRGIKRALLVSSIYITLKSLNTFSSSI